MVSSHRGHPHRIYFQPAGAARRNQLPNTWDRVLHPWHFLQLCPSRAGPDPPLPIPSFPSSLLEVRGVRVGWGLLACGHRGTPMGGQE